MLFSIDKNKSLSILQLVMALFIVTVPSLLGIMESSISLYVMLILSGVLFAMRIKSTGQIHLCIHHPALIILLLYSMLSFLWVNNRDGHLVYMTAITSGITLFGIFLDYFCESTEEKSSRRMMYLITLGGVICAVMNILYWLIYIVPFGKKESLSCGFGSNTFLAVFMLFSIILAFKLIKGNSRTRKNLFIVFIAVMFFVFIMAKSPVAWLVAAILCAAYFISEKSKRLFVPVSLGLVLMFVLIIILAGQGTESGIVFKDVFSYGIKSLLGRGGGYWSAKDIFLRNNYPYSVTPGLLSSLCASSGIIGVLCVFLLIAAVIIRFIKSKTWGSLISVFVTFMMLLLPFDKGDSAVFLWIGLIAYNEKEANSVIKRNIDKTILKRTMYVMAVGGVIAALLLCQNILRQSAKSKYDKGEYLEAYKIYSSASYINITDSESCRMAAQALCKSEKVKEYYTQAVEMSEKAQKRDKYNLLNYEVEAQVYYKCEKYDLCAQKYAFLASKAMVNDKYNLSLVEALYKVVQTSPKGSSETKTAYEKMLEIANETRNLDSREKINNIADKALAYTKGELSVEGEY